MLVLGRKPQESIRVGDAVVTILKVDKNQVTIGIKAPPNVKILRTELEKHRG